MKRFFPVLLGAVLGSSGGMFGASYCVSAQENFGMVAAPASVNPVGAGVRSGHQGSWLRDRLDLTPLFGLSFDRSYTLTNLTEDPASDPDRDAGHALVLDNYQDGFIVSRSIEIEAGTPRNQALHFPPALPADNRRLPGAGLSIGIDATVHSYLEVDQFVQNQAEAQRLPRPGIPEHASDLASWHDGDKATFEADGLLGFAAGAGMGPVSAGVEIYGQGTWTVQVKKKGTHQAYVKISRGKLIGLSGYADSVLVTLDVGLFASADNGFSYRFDLRDPDAAKAYEDFIRGNVFATQKLAQGGSRSVRLEDSNQNRTLGQQASLWMGLPFIFDVNISQGSSWEVENTWDYQDGSKSNVEYGIFTKERSSDFLSSHNHDRVESFVGSDFVDTQSNGATDGGQFGTLLWHDQRESSDPLKFAETVRSLINTFGLENELNVTIPASAGKLNYAGIKLKLTFSQALINYLSAVGANPPALAEMRQGVQDATDRYFNTERAAGRLCPSGNAAAPGVVTTPSGPDCHTQVLAQSLDGVSKLRKALSGMHQYQGVNRTLFVKAFEGVGEALFSSRFVFHYFLQLTHGHGLQFDYSIEGQRISLYEKTFFDPAPTSSSAARP